MFEEKGPKRKKEKKTCSNPEERNQIIDAMKHH
jgi:hypothetical protein